MVMTTIAVADHISPLSATPSVKKESKIQSVTCQTERAKLIIHSYLNQLCKKGRLVLLTVPPICICTYLQTTFFPL